MDEKDDSSNITGVNEDLDTTPPNPANEAIPAPFAAQPKQGKWEMPKPVFRQTSGQLPENFEKRYGRVDEAAPEPTPSMDAVSEPPVVEEQPELAEVLIPEPEVTAEAKPAEEKKSGSAGMLFTLFGFVVILTFLAVFLAVIYFLFLKPQSSGSLF
ncbi:MAG: hypothetical protein KF855_05975 [Acidobacteria bacterium]|nr:hypothetical protein [Acidobacteriota bacterium]